jgi:rSAM/selenodomain-associated transferase 1
LNGIIVFVKNPELGQVKTRLASTLGDIKALEIYNRLLGYTREFLLELTHAKKFVYYSSYIDLEDDWQKEVFEKRLQVRGELGDKITSAVKNTFETCDYVVIIGSDCPQLTSAHIRNTFDQLKSHNIVIGPSLDGGYYLLGMDKMYFELFQDISWSTETVCHETLEKALSLNLNVFQLEALSDIDYEEDWVKYGF